MRDTDLHNDPTHPDYLRAERRVARQLGFFRHLAIYLVVNAGLMLVSLLTSPHHWWSIGPLLGWGIGVLFHALSVFGRFPADWKRAMIARELRRR
ncbi:2TM domain-containing protein [Herbaspirillum sp. AP02]|uniref:2TM domain-containing protein n=1 Tax=unclassified Herbaspirillum TaxID=2624150 RepID=UPI0015D98FE7|nr:MULTISPECIES: 2TM domain-containing protein [unclassified Herbaspirillum]MBG7621049.1 2TM domain-containing protein [Herbaspirillum sp. AP02]NZD68778.1 2TM domain-containing protein [Herbaspirillum sp. AP21]